MHHLPSTPRLFFRPSFFLVLRPAGRAPTPVPEKHEGTHRKGPPNLHHTHGGAHLHHYAPNMLGANVIVCCDVMNALGNGMSLKFMDLFLVQDYGFSPVALLLTSFCTNVCSVYMTPTAKRVISYVR